MKADPVITTAAPSSASRPKALLSDPLPAETIAVIEKEGADLAVRAEICRVAALWHLAGAEPWKFCTKPDCAADPCLRCQARAAEASLKSVIVAQVGEARA